jgi:hypothetical protein
MLAVLTLSGCASARATPAGGARADTTGPGNFADATRGASADTGLFTVYQADDKLLFQVPDSLFGRDLLLVSRIASVPASLGGFIPAGYKAHEQVIRLEREGDRVLVRKMSFEQVAADTLPISISVVSNNFAPIVASLPIAAPGTDGASVLVNVRDFYEKDTPAISGLSQEQRTEFGVRQLDEARSFINYARSFPLNVDVRHTLTFAATKPPSNASTGTISMEMHQSMVLLPEEPMRPRHADPRVGYFSIDRVNFGIADQKAPTQTFIRRWRMEPSDPAAYARGELVDPVEPIIYWIDAATPAQWRPCVRQGIEDWQGPFETAGFSNAIIARQAPSPAEDPEWSAEDVRHSVARWAASLTRNAQGPSVSDPRSGEIIESDIVWYHNHLRSYRNRLMIETGATNPLARSLPIDQTLMCEAMRAVIAHEVGHAIGLPHNMGSSSAYPVDSLRTPGFVRRMGIAPTIMDYARQNYIAQPGDGFTGSDYIRRIGPYDHYSVNWGYRVMPDAPTADAERPILHAWIMEHAGDPIYRFNGGGGGDPSTQTEDLGNDPVRASGYGIANLMRVVPRLLEWTTSSGEDFTNLDEIYGETVGQWARYVGHVSTMIGGVYENHKTADQPGAVYAAVPRAEQEEALAFLADQVFDAPEWLADPRILERLEAAGGAQRIADRQAAVLSGLLSPQRLHRMWEIQVRDPAAAYPLPDFMGDLKEMIWTELAGGMTIDPYRRQLQRTHVERLAFLLTEEPDAPQSPWAPPAVDVSRSDIRPLARQQLRALRDEATRAAGRAPDALTLAHLQDVAGRIDEIFESPRE